MDEVFWEVVFKIGRGFESSFIMGDFKIKFENICLNVCIIVEVYFKVFIKNVNFEFNLIDELYYWFCF